MCNLLVNKNHVFFFVMCFGERASKREECSQAKGEDCRGLPITFLNVGIFWTLALAPSLLLFGRGRSVKQCTDAVPRRLVSQRATVA